MNYGVVIFPSKSLQDKANSYRKRYDPSYAEIAPHITLISAFEANQEEINKIATIIKDVATQFPPFSIKTVKASTFKPIHNTAYLKVETNSTVEHLHEELKQALPFGEKPSYSFVPHITIGQKLSDSELSDLIGRMGLLDYTYEETVDRIHLIYQLENGSWVVYETFHLAG